MTTPDPSGTSGSSGSSGSSGGGLDGGLGGGLDSRLSEALSAFAARDRVLVALDFDGVLSPIVDVPGDARPLPEGAAAVADLVALEGVDVALVSGRALDDLRAVASPPDGVVLVASHGAEVDGAPSPEVPRELLDEVVAALEAVVAEHEGTALEQKLSAAVLHTRRAARDVAAAATSAALAAVEHRDGVHVIRGKEVVEVTVVAADKGTAVRDLRERLGVDAVLYAGDDVTDENAFAVLDPATDVGVKVGDGDTAARHRVAGPPDVAALLAHLATLRPR